MLARRPFLLALSASILTGLAAAGCGRDTPAPATETGAPRIDPATASTVTGRVVVDGPIPTAEMLRIDGDKHCVTLNGSDRVPANFVVAGAAGSLQNVFVYVKAGLEAHRFPVPSEPVIVDQQKCVYVPRVIGVRVGQPLEIRNSDPLLHNVRAEGAVNQPFNMGQPVQGTRFTRTFTTREVMIPFRCDVHAWMHAYIGALDHPFFAVTGQDGTFSLPGLPPGSYTIEAWHEQLGTRTSEVTVGPKESKDVVFTFSR